MNDEKNQTQIIEEENKTQPVKQLFEFQAMDGTRIHVEAYSYRDAIEEYRKYHGYC